MTLYEFLNAIDDIHADVISLEDLLLKIIDNYINSAATNPLKNKPAFLKKITKEIDARPIPKKDAAFILENKDAEHFESYIKKMYENDSYNTDLLYDSISENCSDFDSQELTKDNIAFICTKIFTKILLEFKNKQQTRKKKTKQTFVDPNDINERIKYVVSQIPELDIENRPSNYSIIKELKNKIDKTSEGLLYRKVEPNVIEYFDDVKSMFIEKQAEADFVYKAIQDKVKTHYIDVSQKLSDKPKSYIFNDLVKWLELETCGDKESCEIVISYFIRSCEVF